MPPPLRLVVPQVVAAGVTVAGNAWTVTVNDARGLTDGPTPSQTVALTVDDNRGVTDQTALDRGLAVTDGRGLTDAVDREAVYVRTVDDNRALTDQALPAAGFTADLTDGRGLVDDTARVVALSHTVTVEDQRGLVDSATTVVGWGVAVDDNRALTDTLTTASGYARTVDDGRGLTDGGLSTGKSGVGNDDRGLSDTITTVHTLGGGSQTVTINDNRGLTDTPTARGKAGETTDTRGLTDNLTVVKAVDSSQSVTINDERGISDYGRGVDYAETVDDIAGRDDSFETSQTAPHQVFLSENRGLRDDLLAGGQWSFTLNDNRALTDQVDVVHGRRIITDLLSRTDSLTIEHSFATAGGLFRPPLTIAERLTVDATPKQRDLWEHFANPLRGVTVIVKDGVVYERKVPTTQELNDADAYFLGGHDTPITDPDIRDLLVGAGYELV